MSDTSQQTSQRTKSKGRKSGRRGRGAARSPEDRAERAEAARQRAEQLHATLVEQVEALASTEQWTRYLDFVGSFHSYSFANVVLILAQRPDASLVAGFRQWQAKGRQVRKGERSIKIRGYSTRKVTETDEDTGEETERRLARFPILSVFDIGQTDPAEGADGVDQPEHPAARLVGEDPADLWSTMTAHLTARGWEVAREAIAGETNGYTTTDGTRRIVVEETLSPAMAAKTLLHEAAHATLHVDDEGRNAVDYLADRGRYECEAESVAYVLAGLAGLDTSGYSVGYVATWAGGDVDTLRQTAENVLRTVHTLAPVLIGDVDHDQADDQADDEADDQVDATGSAATAADMAEAPAA